MASDEQQEPVELTAAKKVSLGVLVAASAENPDLHKDPTSLSPSNGRVVKDSATGEVYVGDGSSWYSMDHGPGIDAPGLPGAELIRSADDLPDAESGTRILEDDTAYIFTAFVTDPAVLHMGTNTPMIGWHGSKGGYIHTGGATAFETDGEDFMVDNFYGHAPAGTLFGLSADSTAEMYITDSAFFDPPSVSLGNMSSLGVVDGYRVQTLKSVNLENADDGITFSGTTEKTIMEACPIRNIGVQGNATKIVTLAADYSGAITKLSSDVYVKDVPSDAELVHVEAGGEPSSYLALVDTDVDDSTLNKARLVTGSLGVESVGVRVDGTLPLADSIVRGEVVSDSQATQAGSASGAPVDDGSFSLVSEEKASSPSPGAIQYDARYDSNLLVEAEASVLGDNTTFELSIRRNGAAVETRSESTSSASKPSSVRLSKLIVDANSDTPDTFDAFLNNTGGGVDLDTQFFELRVFEIS